MKRSKEELDTRQVPCRSQVTSEKNYHDLLYSWIQCNSERVALHSQDRWISKKKVKFTYIESQMIDSNGQKIMSRKTISKYFHWLVENEYLIEDGDYYRLRVLEKGEANIVQYQTLSILVNTLQRHCIDTYQYLYSRFCACDRKPFFATIAQIKSYIGFSTETSCNNSKVTDTLVVLRTLKLLDYEYIWNEEEKKEHIRFNWVVDRLPVQ